MCMPRDPPRVSLGRCLGKQQANRIEFRGEREIKSERNEAGRPLLFFSFFLYFPRFTKFSSYAGHFVYYCFAGLLLLGCQQFFMTFLFPLSYLSEYLFSVYHVHGENNHFRDTLCKHAPTIATRDIGTYIDVTRRPRWLTTSSMLPLAPSLDVRSAFSTYLKFQLDHHALVRTWIGQVWGYRQAYWIIAPFVFGFCFSFRQFVYFPFLIWFCLLFFLSCWYFHWLFSFSHAMEMICLIVN